MNIGLKRGLLIALIPLAVAACSRKEEPAQPPVKKAGAPAAAGVAVPADVNNELEVKADELSAKFRNPFQSHIMLLRGADASKKIKGPLECCDFDQFKIVAVVTGRDSGFALVEGPGSKRYVVKRGDSMGPRDGKVVDVTSNGLVVREHIRDEDGKIVSSQDIEVKLPEKKDGSSSPDPQG